MSPKRFIIHFKSTHIYQISAAGYNCLYVRLKKNHKCKVSAFQRYPVMIRR